MKFILLIPLCFFLLLSCGNESAVESKEPKIDSEIQKKLDQIEDEWSNLISDFSNWQANFDAQQKEWIASRPLDSMKIAVEKNSTFQAYLGNAWEQLYEDAVVYPNKVKEWNDANIKTIESFKTESEKYSTWKKSAEEGKFEEKKIIQFLQEQELKINDGILFLKDMQKRWDDMRYHDSEMIKSFRGIF